MKANRKFTTNDKGEIGIGTMIVFIASVLVAAVAAAVLVNTSGVLQDKGKLAGDQSIKRVASNMEVTRMLGFRDDPVATAFLEQLQIYVGLGPGSSKVDLKELIFQWNKGDEFINVPWSAANDGADGGYMISLDDAGAFAPCIRDDDGSVTDPTAGGAALTSGDICVLSLPLAALGANAVDVTLLPNKAVTLTILPQVGSPVSADFVTPESYGTDRYVGIRQ